MSQRAICVSVWQFLYYVITKLKKAYCVIFFSTRTTSLVLDVEIRLVLVSTAAAFRLVSPALKWHYQKRHFQWNHCERVTSFVVVPSKAARSIAWSDLCPVMNLMRLVSQLCSESNVTDVAVRQWFVRCGSIPARFDNFFIILSSVVVPTRWVAKPDFVVCGIELLALTISSSLKRSIWRWFVMVHVVFERFY